MNTAWMANRSIVLEVMTAKRHAQLEAGNRFFKNNKWSYTLLHFCSAPQEKKKISSLI